MAIKNEAIVENGNPPDDRISMESVVEDLRSFENQELDDSIITRICDETIERLLRVVVPQSSVEVKQCKIDFVQATDVLHSIVRQANNPEQIFIHCLQTLYRELVIRGKTRTAI